eukprot:1099856-Prorocentrum_minimum.AAC.1
MYTLARQQAVYGTKGRGNMHAAHTAVPLHMLDEKNAAVCAQQVLQAPALQWTLRATWWTLRASGRMLRATWWATETLIKVGLDTDMMASVKKRREN